MSTATDDERSIRAGLASNDLARITAAVHAAAAVGTAALFDALLTGAVWNARSRGGVVGRGGAARQRSFQ